MQTIVLVIPNAIELKKHITLCFIIRPFDAFEILCTVFENIMENGAFALLEQMLHFPKYFQNYSKLNLNFLEFFQCCLKIENDVMV